MSSDELKISGLRRSFDNGPGGARDVKRIVGGGGCKKQGCAMSTQGDEMLTGKHFESDLSRDMCFGSDVSGNGRCENDIVR